MCDEMEIGGVVVKPELMFIENLGCVLPRGPVAINFRVDIALTPEKAEEMASEIQRLLLKRLDA